MVSTVADFEEDDIPKFTINCALWDSRGHTGKNGFSEAVWMKASLEQV